MIPYSEPWQHYTNPEHKYDKRRCMPFAVAAGVSAAGAIAAGTATAASYVAVAAAVAVAASWVMTAVGLATGDKELLKIGGYVGMAGGIASLGAGMAGAGASAASSAGTTAAQAGQEAVKTTATQAVTPAMQSLTQTAGQQAAQTGSEAAMQAAITPAMQSTAQAGAQTAGQALPTASTSIASLSQDAAKQVVQAPITQGAGVGAEVGNAGDKFAGSGFFDFLDKAGAGLEEYKGAASIGGNLVGAVGDYMTNNELLKQRNAQSQAELDFKKAQYYGNQPGNFSVEARQPTYAEQQAYQRQQAELARQQAKVLTGRT